MHRHGDKLQNPNKKIEFRDAFQRGNLRLKRAKKITPKIYFKY